MKISTRVALGSVFVFILVAGLATWQWRTISRLERAQREIATARLPATALAQELLGDCDLLEEYLRKYQVTHDPGYATAVDRLVAAFDEHLQQLAALEASDPGATAVAGLVGLWRTAPTSPIADPDAIAEPLPDGASGPVARWRALLPRLREQIAIVGAAARRSVADEVRRTAAASHRARNLGLAALLAVLAAAVVIKIVTVRSINRPLRKLIAATRAVAAGEFGHRVETAPGNELTELADHFNTMVGRLDELDRLKRDFVSHVSHEIKTPLVGIYESTRGLLDELCGPLTQQQRRLLELQMESLDRLREMITDLLDLARMEAGVMEYRFDRVDLGRLAADAVLQFEAAGGKREVRLVATPAEELPPVRGDRGRLLQVVHNLLANALRFAPRGSTITVTAEAGENDTATISVSDQGPGVADSQKGMIFERFHQAPGPVHPRPASVGLGLAICRQIVAAHDGRIWVEDAEPSGARFVVELPLAAAACSEPLREVEDLAS